MVRQSDLSRRLETSGGAHDETPPRFIDPSNLEKCSLLSLAAVPTRGSIDRYTRMAVPKTRDSAHASSGVTFLGGLAAASVCYFVIVTWPQALDGDVNQTRFNATQYRAAVETNPVPNSADQGSSGASAETAVQSTGPITEKEKHFFGAQIDEADAKKPTSSNLATAAPRVIIRASSHASFKRRTVLHNRRWVCSEMDRLIFGSSCSPTNHLPSVAWSARRRFY